MPRVKQENAPPAVTEPVIETSPPAVTEPVLENVASAVQILPGEISEPEPAEIEPEQESAAVPSPEPPCPPKGPAGDKDPDYMAWLAEYRPAEFIAAYENRGGGLVKQLLNKARACLIQ